MKLVLTEEDKQSIIEMVAKAGQILIQNAQEVPYTIHRPKEGKYRYKIWVDYYDKELHIEKYDADDEAIKWDN